MYKWVSAILLASTWATGFAAILPDCSSTQVDNIVNKVRTDEAFNASIHNLKVIVQDYPTVKNCAAFSQAICGMGQAFEKVYYSEGCEITENQVARLADAISLQFDREFSETDYRKAGNYYQECFPNGLVCHFETVSVKKAKQKLHWKQFLKK